MSNPKPVAAWLGCVMISLVFPQNVRGDEGWNARVEHLLLAPTISSDTVRNIFYFGNLPSSTEESGDIESELKYAQRLILGYEGSAGGGAQVRWFTFDQDLQYVGQVNEGPVVSLFGDANLDVDAIDAELSQRGEFGIWDLFVTAGARYSNLSLREQAINFEALSDIVWFGSTGFEFQGAGPTLSIAGERQIGNTGTSFFARGRSSLLFGDTELFSAFRSGGSYVSNDESLLVWELQLGSNIERRFETFDLLTGIFWEAQKWDSDNNTLGDIAFHGFGVTTGLRY